MTGDGFKPLAIIVDMDGTYADVEHRRKLKENGKIDWSVFGDEKLMEKDGVNQWCHEIINGLWLKPNLAFLFVTGRMEKYRRVTEFWLFDRAMEMVQTAPVYNNTHRPGRHLFMRADNDFRSDTEVKLEIYNKHIKDYYDVLFALDDRPSVCRMWREQGITVLQCNDKEF